MEAVICETERLVLRRSWEVNDADAALALYGDPEVVRYIGGELVASLDAMRARIGAIRERYAAYRGPLVGAFPARDKATGELIGTALLKYLPTRDASGALVDTADVEIGWHVARRSWHLGYATEMGRALLALGFDHHPVDALHAVVEPPNRWSIAVARRIGMEHVGTTTQYYGRETEHFMASRSNPAGLAASTPQVKEVPSPPSASSAHRR